MKKIILTGLSYALLGALGLAMAIPPGYASPVFPAAGLAVAFALFFGNRILLGIWLGSFTLNISVAWQQHQNIALTSIIVALFLATGATLQAWVASKLVRRSIGDKWSRLDADMDILKFLIVSAPVACVISASIALTTLYQSSVLIKSELFFSWWTWWIGDTLGVLVFSPLMLLLLMRNQSPWKERKIRITIPMLIILLLTTILFFKVSQWEHERQMDHIKDSAKKIAQFLDRRLIAHQEALASLSRLIEVSPNMSFFQFEYFTSITLKENKDIFALSYNSLIKQASRSDFEKLMSNKSPIKGYKITQRNANMQLEPASIRPEYIAVKYIAPLEGNRPAIGYDIYSDPIRKNAIDRSRLTGKAAVTAAIRLVQENKERLGLLVLHPAYKQGRKISEEEDHSLIGYAVAVIKIDELIKIALSNNLPRDLVFKLTDEAADPDKQILYISDEGKNKPDPLYHWHTKLSMADRPWSLTVYPTAEYLQINRDWFAWAIGIAGLIFATLLQVIMLAMTGRTSVIERKVNEQTQELEIKREELQNVLEEHKNLIGRIPVGVFKLRMTPQKDTQYEYVSPLFCEQLGIDQKSILTNSQNVLQTIHPEDLDSYLTKLHESKQKMLPFFWIGRTIRGNKTFWLQIQATPSKLQNEDTVWDGIQFDITEAKIAAESQLLLGSAIKQSSSSVIITDISGKIVFVNDAFSKTSGHQREEVIGKNPHIIQSNHTTLETYHNLIKTISSKKTWYGELQNKKKNNELYWQLTTISPVLNEKGEITHYIIVQDDITDRKEREVELKKAKEAAEKANLAKSQFLATMSHEIRTPMNGVISMAELLLTTELTEKQKKYAEILQSSGRNLLSLINDILDYSKFEAGKLELEQHNFDFKTFIKNISIEFFLQAKQKGLQYNENIDPNIPRYFRGDSNRLRQIIVNILGNALKFTSIGNITTKIILEATHHKNVIVRFKISDTGIGIPNKNQSHLFLSFNQLDSSITRKFGGTGLGLAISKHLANLMGGEIGVESEVGKGSTFWFTVQLEPISSNEFKESSQNVAIQNILGSVFEGKKYRILVAEDNKTNRFVINEFLNFPGFIVDFVIDGKEAISAWESTTYDLIFMDVQMPDMDGYEATKLIRLKEKSTNKHIPIIAITANALKGDKELCLASGMDDYLMKPIEVSDMMTILQKWLKVSPITPTIKELVDESLPQKSGPMVFNNEAMLRRLQGDLAIAKKCIPIFLEDTKTRLEDLQRHIDQNDTVNAKISSHAIKGAAANTGGEIMQSIAAKIEQLAKKGELSEASIHMSELRDAFNALTVEMENWMNQH